MQKMKILNFILLSIMQLFDVDEYLETKNDKLPTYERWWYEYTKRFKNKSAYSRIFKLVFNGYDISFYFPINVFRRKSLAGHFSFVPKASLVPSLKKKINLSK